MIHASKTRLRALFYQDFLRFLLLAANITKTKLLGLFLQGVQLLKLTCLETLHQVLLLNAIAATSYKLVQILLVTLRCKLLKNTVVIK